LVYWFKKTGAGADAILLFFTLLLGFAKYWEKLSGLALQKKAACKEAAFK
jgi:hypothetical protein